MQNNNPKLRTDVKKRAYLFALGVIQFADTLDRRDFVVRVVVIQLLRSVTSIGANIVEAQAGSTRKDFTNFYAHALKSANETKFWLALLRDSKKALGAQVNPLLEEVAEIANILAASILTLRGKRH